MHTVCRVQKIRFRSTSPFLSHSLSLCVVVAFYLSHSLGDKRLIQAAHMPLWIVWILSHHFCRWGDGERTMSMWQWCGICMCVLYGEWKLFLFWWSNVWPLCLCRKVYVSRHTAKDRKSESYHLLCISFSHSYTFQVHIHILPRLLRLRSIVISVRRAVCFSNILKSIFVRLSLWIPIFLLFVCLGCSSMPALNSRTLSLFPFFVLSRLCWTSKPIRMLWPNENETF